MHRRWRGRMVAAMAATLAVGVGAIYALETEPTAGPTTAFTDGNVKLIKPASPFDKEKMHVVKLGDRLQFECNFFIDDFFDKSIIWAGANVLNPTDETMYFEYSVAFFDEKNHLVGCASQGSYGGVEAGQSTQLGSCLITLDRRDIDRITRFQVRVYESNREIGEEKKPASASDVELLNEMK